MSLYKRGRVWWAIFYVDGIRHQISTKTANRRDAERILDQLKRDAALKAHALTALDPDMTFGALVARFIGAGESRRHHRDRFTTLLSYFADMPVGQISKSVAREYRQARISAKRVTDATVNRDLSVLRHLLYWAVDEGLLSANPLMRIRMVRERPAPRPVVRIEEERQLLAFAPPHLRDLTILAIDTGMRHGELLHQRWDHVDFARGLLAVSQSKTAGGEGREIPFTTRVKNTLCARRAEHGLLFLYQQKGIQSVKTSWKGTIRRAGLRHLRFHDLRHTFNTRLVDLGVLQEVRKALMGHATGSSVHARYTHIELPLKREAVQRLDAWHQAHFPVPPGSPPSVQEDTANDGSEKRVAERASATRAQALEEENAD